MVIVALYWNIVICMFIATYRKNHVNVMWSPNIGFPNDISVGETRK